MRSLWLAAAALYLAGCGRYADFTLPAAAGGDGGAGFELAARPEPVLGRGAGFDSHDVLNPSVVRHENLLNLYSAFDGRTWSTGAAVSEDGATWRKLGLVLAPDAATWEGSYIAANGSALFFGGRYWYWYQAGPKGAPRLGLALSGDARVWRKEPKPVLDHGPYMSWDERAVADPWAVRIGPYFYLYYLGQDRAARQRLGLARSLDGIHWEKLRANPILELGGPGAFDENGLGEPAVWNSHGYYWMLYTGRDRAENRRLGLARSLDGVHWRKQPAVFEGPEAWDAKVICDASVLVEGDTVRVWFGGGDRSSPDENLDGQIGYGVLRPVHATLAP
jgi:predicted GH43/DUF377 family glycosyl hydrolase